MNQFERPEGNVYVLPEGTNLGEAKGRPKIVAPTTIATDPSTLLSHKGHPVPWVTRWTGEIVEEQLSVAMDPDGLLLHYPRGNEDREANGVLWYREGIKRGGEPEYSQVNVYRQRASMRKCLCQVCGKKIDARPISWITPIEEPIFDSDDGHVYTQTPPVCDGCAALALHVCPALRSRGYRRLKVLEYEIAGVYGEAIVFVKDRTAMSRRKGLTMVFDQDYGDDFSWRAVGAKQQVVRLTKFVVEEVYDPTPVAP